MIWTSAISEQPILEDAIADCYESIRNEIKSETVDLAGAFVSPQHEASYDRLTGFMAKFLRPNHIFGCSGGG